MRPRKYFLTSLLFILFFIAPQQSFPQTPDGDLAPLGNRDGIVNVGDALVALRFALALETPTQEDMQHGDVAPLDNTGLPSPDGQITVGDALVILRHALGLIGLTPTGMSGLWMISMTETGGTEEEEVVILLLQSDTALSLETITLDDTSTSGTASLTGTQIALSWEEAEKTISLTGTVVNDTMSGTWMATSGGAGTWSAQRALELGDPTITFPETGTILLELQEEGDIGSATFYGTQTDQGPAFPLTGFTMTIPEGECVVTLDDQERPVTMTMGTMEVTFTYNLDDTFNYELKENGSLIYSGSAISTGEGNTTKSMLSHSARSTNSVVIGNLPNEKALRYGRSNRDEERNLDEIIESLIRKHATIKGYEPTLVERFVKNPQIRTIHFIAITMQVIKNYLQEDAHDQKAISMHNQLISFSRLLAFYLEDIVNNEEAEYHEGRDHDFDKDGFTENQGDCNDRDPNEFPGQVWLKDADGDGYSDGNFMKSCLRPKGYKLPSELKSCELVDCKDDDPGRAWDNPEVCDDGKDNDCDQLVNCEDPDCVNDPACPQCPRPGDPADWALPCEGGCMPIGAECCYGKGGWCPAGSKCMGQGCCPLERICDGVVCMVEGGICCSDGNGRYCPSNYPICCPNGKCCSADKPICCPNGCCPEDKPKCCPMCCCPQGYECCCPYCCPPGKKCQGGECVPATP